MYYIIGTHIHEICVLYQTAIGYRINTHILFLRLILILLISFVTVSKLRTVFENE